MPSVNSLKIAFINLLRPIAAWLARHKITAPHVVKAAMTISILTGVTLALFPHRRNLLILPVVLSVRMALNIIHDLLVQEFAMATTRGAILKELEEVISEAALYLPFCAVAGFPAFWVIVTVFLGLVSEMAGVLGTPLGTPRRNDGPLGENARALIFGVIALIVGIAVRPGIWLGAVFIVMVIMLILTIFNRYTNSLQNHL